MYRIYINDTVLILTENAPNAIENYQQVDFEQFDFMQFYNHVKSAAAPGIYLLVTPKANRLFKQIKNSVKMIKAAGGLVNNEQNKYLFIFRKGKWDLPKGKLDAGEKTKKAAVREVEEECGIAITKVSGKICKTYHVYEMNNKIILKKTTWYAMRADNQEKLVPQVEEEITDARWLAAGDFMMVKQNTYPLIRDVIGFVED